jgi:ABC-type phosphate transport system auxiliary subunit
MRKALLTLLRKYSRYKEEIAQVQEQVLVLRQVINRQSILLKDTSQKISKLERLQELYCKQYRMQLSEFVWGYDLQSKSPL